MPSLTHNVIANAIGRVWSALMAVAFVPLYIKFMGIEAYGIVGIYLTLFAVMSLLDLGLSTTLNRELARLAGVSRQAQRMRDMVRTLEMLYWGLGILAGLAIVGMAPLLAHYWVKPQSLAPEDISQALQIMGIAVMLHWPFALYSGGLLGIQQQVPLAAITVAFATARAVGAVLVLWWVAPTIKAFFVWQLVVSLAQTLVTAAFLWSRLERGERAARYSTTLLNDVRGFAIGITGISVVAVLLTQTDKIMLSSLLTLDTFGYYTLSAQVAMVVGVLVAPFFMALFPRLSNLVAKEDVDQVRSLYHRGNQAVAVAVVPVAGVIATFAPEILELWSGDSTLSRNAAVLVTLLTLGTALNALMNIPFALQLAHAWTAFAFYLNLACLFVLLPALYWATLRYGAVGAASVWVALNAFYVLIGMRFMHMRLLPGELGIWYRQDIGPAIAVVVAVCFAGRYLLPADPGWAVSFLYIGGALLASFGMAVLVTTYPRNLVLGAIRKLCVSTK